ncbi:HEPN domain-containing protein [Propionivibrio sp.]|uniref:HEPN domain-containing protein n=1 Tax=Propionivibrio sp. TaxID=2212460 RepID=UPI003BF25068
MKKNLLEAGRGLFRKAGHDLQAAELLLREGATDVICFHLQQSVEKYLKAYLQANAVEFPRTHDLDALLDICASRTEVFEDFRDRLEVFIPYAVMLRYEMDFEPSREEAKTGLVLACEVRDRLAALVPGISASD